MSLLVNRQPSVLVPSCHVVVVAFFPCVWIDLVLVVWLVDVFFRGEGKGW